MNAIPSLGSMAGPAAAWFNVAVCLGLPLGVLIFLLAAKSKRRYAVPMMCGVVSFAVAQVVLRIPLLEWLDTQPWWLAFKTGQPVLYIVLIGGLTAGIFEEGMRWLCLRFVLTAVRQTPTGLLNWGDGMAFGLGHGGFEAFWLVGREWLGVLAANYATLRFVSPWMVLPYGLERILAMVWHLALSLMVLRAVRDHKPLWLLWAVLAHALGNSVTALVLGYTGSLPATYVVMALLTAAALVYIIFEKRKEIRHEKSH